MSEQYVEESNLRISMQRFTKELLRNERKTVGRYDSRLEGEDIDAAGERPSTIPAMPPCKAYSRRCSTNTSAGI